MKQVTGGVCAAQGFSAAGIHCGIRKNRTKRDLALIIEEMLLQRFPRVRNSSSPLRESF